MKKAYALETEELSFESNPRRGRRVATTYRLDPPYQDDDGAVDYVVVSAIDSAFETLRPETYIFRAGADGEIQSWGELPGSYRGGTDHARALKGLGYEVVSA